MIQIFFVFILFCTALFGTHIQNLENSLNSEIAPIKSYVLDENFILTPKSSEFIQLLGSELHYKTNFSLQMVVVNDSLIEAKNLLINILEIDDPKFSTRVKKQLEHIEHLINSQKLTLKEMESADKKTAQKIKAKIAQERVLAYKSALFLHYEFLDSEFLSSAHAVIIFFYNDQKIEIFVSEPAKGILDSEKVYFDYIAPLLPKKDEKLTPNMVSAILLNGYSYAADMVAAHYKIELENNIRVDGSGDNEFTRIAVYLMILLLFASLLIARFGKK